MFLSISASTRFGFSKGIGGSAAAASHRGRISLDDRSRSWRRLLKQFVEHVVSSVDEGDILQFGSVSNVLLAVRLGKGACPGPARGTPPGQPRTAGAGVQHTGGSSAAPGRALIVDGLGGGERSREERMAGAYFQKKKGWPVLLCCSCAGRKQRREQWQKRMVRWQAATAPVCCTGIRATSSTARFGRELQRSHLLRGRTAASPRVAFHSPLSCRAGSATVRAPRSWRSRPLATAQLGQGPAREELEFLGAIFIVGSQLDAPDEVTAEYHQSPSW